MSLVTCCPACSTMFKVVPDQLRISHGWVRCGHCSEVFDAASNMQPRAVSSSLLVAVEPPGVARDTTTEPPQVPPTRAQWPAPPLPAPPLPAPATQAPTPAGAASMAANPVDALLNKAWPDAPDPALPVGSPRATDPRPVWRTPPKPVATAPSAPHSEPFETLNSRFHELPEPSDSDSPKPGAEPEPLEPPVSFVRAARRRAFWHSTGVRLLLGLLMLTGLAALALQVAHHERNRLAALYPQARPALAQMCQHLQCQLKPLAQIESIVVDSSSFNKLQGGSYRFNVALKNQAALPLAMPAVELTLTDSQDQPVLRRVLQPADLGSKSGVMDAAATWSSTLVISVLAADGSTADTTPDSARIAGYRVLAFYP